MSSYKNKKIYIRLKTYEVNILKQACDKILATVTKTRTKVIGPIPLPTRYRRYCVLRSPHVNKTSREHFEIRIHKRLFCFSFMSEEFVTNLRKLDLPAGVNVKIIKL